jgi:very-short-patch-repair endonuclease
MLRTAGIAFQANTTIGGCSVDVYIPQWNTAIEYQGGQHYKQINTGSFER